VTGEKLSYPELLRVGPAVQWTRRSDAWGVAPVSQNAGHGVQLCVKGSRSPTTNDETETDSMQGYKEPGFNDRVAAANSAKAKALEMLKNKPKPSEAQLAERAERQRAKEAAAAEKRAAAEAAEKEKRAAAEAAAAAAEEARAAAVAAQPRVPTSEELKAARDARYAARKMRNR
jgi:hypothetical protein